MSNEITVRIVADASQLKAGTGEASEAVSKMGDRFEESGGKIEKVEGTLAHLSTHIAAEAIPGMGRRARSIGILGETAVGMEDALKRDYVLHAKYMIAWRDAKFIDRILDRSDTRCHHFPYWSGRDVSNGRRDEGRV